jgi:hypothetical protein
VTVVWRLLAPNPDTVGFTLDSLTGLITALSPGGSWPVQGHVEELRTEPAIQVSVVAAPDSLAAGVPALDTVPLAETESAALAVVVYDLTTSVGEALGLSGKRVVFRLADPAPGSPAAAGVALSEPGQDPRADPHTVERTTAAGGLATVAAERVTGLAQPDSIVIEASAYTARGTLVPGSPARLLVFFSLN